MPYARTIKYNGPRNRIGISVNLTIQGKLANIIPVRIDFDSLSILSVKKCDAIM